MKAGSVFFQADQLSPEREPPVLAVITNQVYCNSQKPGLNGAFAAETVTVAIGSKEALLSQSACRVHVLHQHQNYAVYTPLMLTDNLVELCCRNPLHRFFRSRTQG